jgi:hypothetical protein
MAGQFWVPSCLLSNMYRVFFCPYDGDMPLTIVPMLKICAAPPLRLQGMVLLINQRDSFITVVFFRTGRAVRVSARCSVPNWLHKSSSTLRLQACLITTLRDITRHIGQWIWNCRAGIRRTVWNERLTLVSFLRDTAGSYGIAGWMNLNCWSGDTVSAENWSWCNTIKLL